MTTASDISIKERGVWAQARNSLQQCFQSGAEFILYTEPDKMDFIKNFLPAMLEEIDVDENSGIVMACRSTRGFATYPVFQQMTETTINNCCAEVIGKNADYTYGPFLLSRKLIPYLDLVKEDIGWGWRPYVFNMAHRLNLDIQHYERDFSCPPDQRNDNASERLYRMRQLAQNIQAIVLSSIIKPDEH